MKPVVARLRDVCFAHWPVDPGALDRRLPDPLSVATAEGAAWVTVLGMVTRPLAWRIPLSRAFSQVTLRTYVRTDGEPAVYFVRIDADGRLAVAGARRLFGVPFRYAETSVARVGGSVRVRTGGEAPAFEASFERPGTVRPVGTDGLDAWLTDRYGYALADGRRGRVDHDAWSLAPAAATVRANGLFEAAGLPEPVGEPRFRYSPGLDIELAGWPS